MWRMAVWHGFKKPRFFLKKTLKNLKCPNLGFFMFKKNKNLMSDLSFKAFFTYYATNLIIFVTVEASIFKFGTQFSVNLLLTG